MCPEQDQKRLYQGDNIMINAPTKDINIRTSTIIALKEQDKTLTLQEIGDRVGCTRERVRQILVAHNIDTSWEGRRGYKIHTQCSKCNGKFDSAHYKLIGICRACMSKVKYKKFLAIRTKIKCPTCKQKFLLRKKDPRQQFKKNFCSHDCRATYYRKEVGNSGFPWGFRG